ncbi:hypothetical protein NUM3379_27750 [Kineococcus sp. NUM-3379]
MNTSTRARRAVVTAALGSAVLAGTAVATSAPASADFRQCSPGQFCFWSDSRYNGSFSGDFGSNSNIGSALNDSMTSYWNRTNKWVAVYEHGAFRNCMISIPPGGSSANVSHVFNDRMTSFRIDAVC